ncbi:MAG: hypothetical protein ACFFAN_18125 [Promethearchaeota archaeon]
MELFEEETEIYNSKMRLLTWLAEELTLYQGNLRKKLIEIGKKLPLNF